MLFSIVVPVYNEALILLELYQRLSQSIQKITLDYEIIFVNDGSKDTTLDGLCALVQKDPKVKYISFTRNFGHQIAVTAGLEHVKGATVIIIDGDLQDPPELFPELYKRYKEGYDIVYAQRKVRKGETYFKKITANLFYRILNKITSIDIPLDTGDYRLIDRKVVESLKKMPEKNKFLRGQMAWLGYKSTAVTFERDSRKYGETGYPLYKMIRFALDGVTAFSDYPLQLISKAGIIISGLAFLIIIYALFSHFVLQQTLSGWTSLIISVVFLGGIQLFSIGIIGLYISRMNSDLKNRPLYIIDQTNI